jgi:hypothetical protein
METLGALVSAGVASMPLLLVSALGVVSMALLLISALPLLPPPQALTRNISPDMAMELSRRVKEPVCLCGLNELSVVI